MLDFLRRPNSLRDETVERARGKRIAIMMAMEGEAQPVVERLGLEPRDDLFETPVPLKVFSGHRGETEVILVVSGADPETGMDRVGTEAATLTAFETIRNLKPDLLINAGTAGGIQAAGAAVGDVFQVTASSRHDRVIPIPGFDVYGVNASSDWAGVLPLGNMRLKQGAISTGNSLPLQEGDRQRMNTTGSVLKDMEAAAVRDVAAMFDVPLVGLKAVTDMLDGGETSEAQFLANLELAAANLARAVDGVVAQVARSVVGEV